MVVWHQDGGGPALVAIEVEGSRIVDEFNRTETDAWGSADTGQAWTITGGAADDYLTNGTVAAHLLDSVNVPRHSIVGSNLRDVDITIGQIFNGVVPAGAPIQVGLLARWTDSSNYLFARLFLLDDDSALINLVAVVGGAETTTSNIAVDDITASSTRIAMRFQVEGTSLRARAWDNTTTEPTGWQVELEHTGLDYGAVGIRSLLQSGNTNTPPVIFTYDRFRCAISEWFDITGDVLHAAGGLDVDMAGRQTELERTDNAALRLTVDNADGRYTPGAPTSAYELRQGQRIQVRETIGRRTFPLFTGTIQQPEAVYGTTSNEATVTLSAVDAFGELEQGGRTFVSTLGEYIRDAGGSALVGYWPLGEASGALQAESMVPTQGPLTIERRSDFDGHNAPANSLISFGAADGPAMDDISGVEFNALTSDASLLVRDRLIYRTVTGADFADSATIAVSIWSRVQQSSLTSWQIIVARDDTFTTNLVIDYQSSVWRATASDTAGSVNISAGAPLWDRWQLLTLAMTSAGDVYFWVDQNEFTGSIGGAATGDFDSILVDSGTPGSAACHLQLYAGTYTRKMHLAQYAQGVNTYTGGLRFQRTDERFRTVARYAGLPEPDCDHGSVWMQRAELAGKTFAEAAGEAIRTEQGRAFVSGAGVPQFHSRVRTKYNF